MAAGLQGFADAAFGFEESQQPGYGLRSAQSADSEQEFAFAGLLPGFGEQGKGFGAPLGGDGHGGVDTELGVCEKALDKGEGCDAFSLDDGQQALADDFRGVVAQTGFGAEHGVGFKRSDLADGADDVDARQRPP